jgi:hypothetical protein
MPTVTNADPTKPALRFPIPVPVLVVAVFAIAAAAAYWSIGSRQPAAQGPVLTPEAKAYVKYLPLGGVEMKARESYSKQTLVEITGKISNTGNRNLKLVEVNCIFYDPYGQLVLRDRVPIVREKTGGLKAGQTNDFRLAFDTIPESWNQAMPQLVIAQIIFE